MRKESSSLLLDGHAAFAERRETWKGGIKRTRDPRGHLKSGKIPVDTKGEESQ